MIEGVMHVGIEQPVEKRKDVLNVAIDVIQALKEFEASRNMSKEREAGRKNFIQLIKELDNKIQEFKDSMPAIHVVHPHEEKKEEAKPEKEEVKHVVKKHVKKKTHLDDLEDDIARLREKISRL